LAYAPRARPAAQDGSFCKLELVSIKVVGGRHGTDGNAAPSLPNWLDEVLCASTGPTRVPLSGIDRVASDDEPGYRGGPVGMTVGPVDGFPFKR
jgi:hypothetical protein